MSMIALASMAQRNANDTIVPGKQIDILRADRYNAVKVDSATNLISLGGNVLVRQEKTLFYADSIVLNSVQNTLEAFVNVHINDADSVHTYAQYLKYLGKEKKAYLKKKVKQFLINIMLFHTALRFWRLNVAGPVFMSISCWKWRWPFSGNGYGFYIFDTEAG